VLKTEKEVA